MSKLISIIDTYIKSYSSVNALERGKSVAKSVSLEMMESATGLTFYKVPSESSNRKTYVVKLTGLLDGNIKSTCTCQYNYRGVCKHVVGVLLDLKEQISKGTVVFAVKTYTMLDTVSNMGDIYEEALKNQCLAEVWKKKNALIKIDIKYALNSVVEAEILHKKENYKVHLVYKPKEKELHSSCSCNQVFEYPYCEHKVALLLKLRDNYGQNAFDVLKDWTAEKNALLAEYGFSLDDDIEQLFDFKVQYSKLVLINKDPSVQKIGKYQNWSSAKSLFNKTNKPIVVSADTQQANYQEEVIFILDRHNKNVPDYTLTYYSCRTNFNTRKITHLQNLQMATFAELAKLDELSRQIIGLNERVIKESGNYVLVQMPNASIEEKDLARQEVSGPLLNQLLSVLSQKRVFRPKDFRSDHYYYGYGNYGVNNLVELVIDTVPQHVYLKLKEEGVFVVLEGFVELKGNRIGLGHLNTKDFFWLFLFGNVVYKWADYKTATIVNILSATGGSIKVHRNNFEGFFAEFVMPLSKHLDIDIDLDKPMVNHTLAWKGTSVYLREINSSLVVTPTFEYTHRGETLEFAHDSKTNSVEYAEGQILILERDEPREKETYDQIIALHPQFDVQKGQEHLALSYSDVLKDFWFYDFFEKAQSLGLTVLGSKALKFKYNYNRPKMQVRASSGIDWFDLQIEIQFGEQFASLKDVRKAIMKKQNFVELKDGSLGLLPEEWLKQYDNLFRFGKAEDNSLKISKLHFTLVEELSKNIDSEAIQNELYQKRNKLLNFKEIKEVQLPHNISATLRDYQIEGYKWLSFLDEFGWGGCLADDMGLGKTLQVLTFLQEQINRFPNASNLVVVPTSLVFNWQAEIQKFCKDIKLLIRHGNTRIRNAEEFAKYHIVITTYGTIRSDIEFYNDFTFNYIILDESQAIKNPSSQISKAVRLLKGRNRLVMTGTPIENNTFDLYSQFEFLNPGFLGTEEFFKTEFANPIDKQQDPKAIEALKKLVYPFMLKRTKEEVAKDLPDKTETILFCELGKKQRKVYDTFKDKYRMELEEKLETEGREKSGMLILEGLLKLRQICDSPALLSGDESYPEESVKLEEITREIEENASNHKILVFSQFVKMLDLVRAQLEKNKLAYEYLDGTTKDRGARVRRFQNDPDCKVFLISLKAGGVGLNLTEADYVYLIDPWWNPAVEQQAIDRTHRIGQQKKVFAYKMICKDTVEEKILLLQSKKKQLAGDIVGGEAGFVKKLSNDDIIDLFS
jgi:SNF2 family DNA or RNA helicase/uncharacterized Zn finger protein